MNKEFEKILINYNADYSRLFEAKTISYNNNLLSKNSHSINSGPYMIRGTNHIQIDGNVERIINLLFNNVVQIKSSDLKGDIVDAVSMNKYKALKEIEKYVENKTLGKFKNERQERLLSEFVIAHELAHVYFPNKNKSTYDSTLNLIKMNDSATNTIGTMRDEMRADTLAYLMMKKRYGEDNDFKEMLEHFAGGRLKLASSAIANNAHQYNLYHIYRKDMDFLKKLPELNQNTLPEIEKRIDDITLKTVKAFGIKTSQVIENNQKFLEENVKNVQGLIDESCEMTNPFMKVVGASTEQCLAKEHIEINNKIFANFNVPIIIDKEEQSESEVKIGLKPN